jgi:hypothetical protein
MVLAACKKDEGFNNMLRIRNSLSTIAVTCKAGSVDFGTIAPGITTDYKVVAEGESTLSGNITGTITLPENLTEDHLFTLSLNADSTITLAED